MDTPSFNASVHDQRRMEYTARPTYVHTPAWDMGHQNDRAFGTQRTTASRRERYPHSLSLLVFVEDDGISADCPFHVHAVRAVASLEVNHKGEERRQHNDK